MNRKLTVVTNVVLLIAVSLFSAGVQATSGNDAHTSLLNPWNPATLAVEKAVERGLKANQSIPHAGSTNNFSSWNLFTDYSFGKLGDNRPGGFDNYFNSYTVGADALYNSSLWGFMGNLDDAQGHTSGGARGEIDTWTYSLYTSNPISECMFWGASFSFGEAENKIRGVSGTTDTESYVFAPYLTMLGQLDQIALSLSPSYVLGYQDVDYPQGNPDDDTALMGKMVLMGRAACALTEKMMLSLNLNYNHVLHNHGLDTESDNDHQWFTTGAKLGYQFSENLSGSLGYNTGFESNFDSNFWTLGLNYAF